MAAVQDSLDGLDEAALNLIVSLQLEDARTVESQQDNSAAVAIRLFTEELKQDWALRRAEDETGEPDTVDETDEPDAVCASCEDRVPARDLWRAPCEHPYCTECLEQLYTATSTDETLYPPRCCRQPMPWDQVRPRIDYQVAVAFERKIPEFDVAVANRIYCSGTACLRFIGAKQLDTDIAACPSCEHKTCTLCGSASHQGDCPADSEVQKTLELAKSQGWRRCDTCKAIVDLAVGCFHITYVPSALYISREKY